jgi:hypothetical protein
MQNHDSYPLFAYLYYVEPKYNCKSELKPEEPRPMPVAIVGALLRVIPISYVSCGSNGHPARTCTELCPSSGQACSASWRSSSS